MPIKLPVRKPCPFCGSEDTFFGKYADQQGDFYRVECRGCGAGGPTSRKFQDNALLLWNIRSFIEIVKWTDPE